MTNFDSIPTGSASTAAYRLVQKTLAGDLTWSPDETFKPNLAAGLAFRSEHEGDLLRLYGQTRFDFPTNDNEPRQVARLEFIDTEGKVLWSFPPHQSIDDLYRVVERQKGVANPADSKIIEDKLRKILKTA